jgi:hypothetical protein
LNFSCLSNYNQSDVVILRMAAGEIADIIGQTGDNSLRSFARTGAHGSDHSFGAEFISVCVEHFGDAVGVKDEAIIAFERDGKVAGYPIEHVSAVNPEGHPGRLQNLDLAGRGAVEERRIMPPTGEGHVVVLMVENDVGHANEHVLLDIGIELAIDLPQNLGGRLAEARFRSQDAAADRHDERGGHALARDIGDDDAEPVVVHPDVVEIVAADLACRDVNAGDIKAVDRRRLRGKKDALDVARDLQVVVEPFLLVRFRIDDSVVEGEGCLL